MCGLEPTYLARVRTREGTSLVTKEVALDQCLRKRSTVDDDELAMRALGEFMNVACDDLFTGPRFARDEHGCIAWSYLPNSGKQLE